MKFSKIKISKENEVELLRVAHRHDRERADAHARQRRAGRLTMGRYTENGHAPDAVYNGYTADELPKKSEIVVEATRG